MFVFVETIGQTNSAQHMYAKTTDSLECSSENICLCVLFLFDENSIGHIESTHTTYP